MSTTLVTGATGLIGSHVVRALVERGDDVRATVRPRSNTTALDELGVAKVSCDVLDRRAMRRALAGADRVFHCAGTTSLRLTAAEQDRLHVGGTRIVLEEALKSGVERVVLTSSCVAFGPAPKGSTADETQVFRFGRAGLPLVNAKHAAEVEALRMAAKGLPVVIVNPAHVLGPGDLHRSSTDLIRRFLRRELPAYVDGALCVVHVSDVAKGHLLADEKGTVGERYILGNRNFTLDRLFADLGRLSGVEPPALKLPLSAAVALARTAGSVRGGPRLREAELQAMAQWWTYRSTKAKRELGYTPRHHEDALVDTIAWLREQGDDRIAAPGARQPAALRLAGYMGRRVESLTSTLRG